jgi:hypothetical protein
MFFAIFLVFFFCRSLSLFSQLALFVFSLACALLLPIRKRRGRNHEQANIESTLRRKRGKESKSRCTGKSCSLAASGTTTTEVSRGAASARGGRPAPRRAITLLILLPRLLRAGAGEEDAVVASERFTAVTAMTATEQCFLTAAALRQSLAA